MHDLYRTVYNEFDIMFLYCFNDVIDAYTDLFKLKSTFKLPYFIPLKSDDL